MHDGLPGALLTLLCEAPPPPVQGLADPGAVGAPQQLAHPLAGGGQLVEVDAGAHAKAVQQIDHLFRRHIAGGTGA